MNLRTVYAMWYRISRTRVNRPSIRNPRSGDEIILVSLLVVALVLAVNSLFESPFVRIEVALVLLVVLVWDAWAIYRLLGEQTSSGTRRR